MNTLNAVNWNGMRVKAVASLRQMGCTIRAVKAAPCRPVIEIDYAPSALRATAIDMIVEVDGLRRRAYAARLCGALVHWSEPADLPAMSADLYLLDKAHVAL